MSEEVLIGSKADFSILCAGALRRSVHDAAQAYHMRHGIGCLIKLDTAGGLAKRVRGGERVDCLASSYESLESLSAEALLGGSIMSVGEARMALGVRKGAPVPDISSVEKLVALLRAAPVIVRGDPAGGGTGGIHLQAMIEKLGLLEETAPRTVLRVGGYNVMKEVVEGRAPFAMTQSTEIVPIPEVEIGAYLPDEVQLVTRYALALAKPANEAARAFLTFATSSETRLYYTQAGFAI
jgi:molybdate transport system substrate-binding protein